jgi:hypothetical protein
MMAATASIPACKARTNPNTSVIERVTVLESSHMEELRYDGYRMTIMWLHGRKGAIIRRLYPFWNFRFAGPACPPNYRLRE